MMAVPAGGRLRYIAGRARPPALGLAGQLLNAATNVATAFVASLLLRPEDFGVFVLGFACVTLALASGRGLIGTTMLAQLPAAAPVDRPALLRSALGFTVLVGIGASLVLLAISSWVAAVLLFAPWVTVALVQDVGRYAFLAEGRTGAALLLDGVWAAAQVLTVSAWWLTGGTITLGLLATAWGIGALAGVVALAVLLPPGTRPSSPRRWARTTRDVAGWFTALAVLGQAEIYVVLLLVGALLGAREAGGLRAVQLLVFQPPMVLLGAVLMLATPAVARRGATAGTAALSALWRRTALAVTPVALAILAVAALGGPLMSLLFAQYTDYTSFVLPVALQSALAAFGVPSLALFSGTRRGALAFVLAAGRSGLVVVAVVVGVAVAGPTGLVWALAVSSALSLTAVTGVAFAVLRRDPVARREVVAA